MINYAELIEKVKAIDTKAAEYLETGARELSSFAIDGECDTLKNSFTWAETPQGADFWKAMYYSIGEG